MADKKITEMDAIGDVPADTDVLPLVDVSGTPTTKKVTVAHLREALNFKVHATGQTTSYGTKLRDDGYYESGATLRYSTTDVGGEIIVNDLNTGLMWEQKTVANKATTYTWENAQIYCEDQIGTTGTYAGYSDWRLPNIKELVSIVKYDANISAPYIDQTYFPNTQSNNYWSSTTNPDNTGSALSVYFHNGNVYYNYKSNTYCVRCVRGQ